MTKLEEYTGKAVESLAALNAATSERERAFHGRAHAIWRRLIASEATATAAATKAAKPKK